MDIASIKWTTIKFTQDEWYGNSTKLHNGKPTRTVEVSEHLYNDGTGRISIWGNDDFGLEKEYNTHEEAKATFDIIKKMEYVNIQPLKDMGFFNA